MRRKVCSLLAAITLSTTTMAAAQETDSAPPPNPGNVTDTKTGTDEAKPSETEKAWELTGGFDYLTQYLFRGYNTVPSGLIIQPYVDFAYTIYDKNDLSIVPHIGLWGDFTEKSGPHDWDKFAEGDVTAGVGFGYKNFNLTINYNYQGYPSKYAPGGGEISEVQEMQFLVSYDDSACFEKVPVLAGLNPHVSLVREIKDRNDHDNNEYLELGLEPTFKEIKLLNLPVTFSVPLTVGLSTDSYFTDDAGHNETCGFYSAGVKASIPIPMNEKYGSWSVTFECDYVHLEAQSTVDSNTGDDDDIVGRVGVQFTL